MFYYTLVTLHIIFAGIWISNFLVDFYLRKKIHNSYKLIDVYLKLINLLSSISAIGILITGILLVLNSGYGFFRMTDNHWLVSKQFLMVILLFIIGMFVIPTSKKLRLAIGNENSFNPESNEVKVYLKKVLLYNNIINSIVIINFLFAITHRYIG